MKVSLFLGNLFYVAILVVLISMLNASRNKRKAYELPDGYDLIVGDVRSSFVCSSDGYYADQENECKIFHVCRSITNTDGSDGMLQWSFLCGNQTIFNQFSFTCAHPEDSIPCEKAADFYNLNDIIGFPNERFHTLRDVAKAEAFPRGLPFKDVLPFIEEEEWKGAGGHSGGKVPVPTRPKLLVAVLKEDRR